MASRTIRGITIEFGADTGKLLQSFSTLKNESTQLTKKFNDINRLLRFNPKNVELLTQKQSELKNQIKNTEDRLENLKRIQSDMKARGISKNSDEFKALRREVIDTEKQLSRYKDQLSQVNEKLNISNSKLGQMSEKLQTSGKFLQEQGAKIQNFGSKMSGLGTKMTLGLTVPIVAAGKKIFDAGSDFESGMSKVQAISNASQDDMKKLEKVARDMGRTTKFSATEASDGLTYMAMAGWKTEQMVAGLPGIMNLAAASGEDLGMVSDIVTDALSAFGMQAGQSAELADLLASASSNANTNVGMLGESFKYVAPVAGALGYTAEDTALALGIMANAGIKSSQAGTSLRNIMSGLVNPTKESAKAIENLNISVANGDGELKPLNVLLGELRTKFKGLTKEQKAQYAASIAGKNGMSGFLALMEASEDDFNKLSKATKNYTGEAKRMADTMENNAKGKITKLKSALGDLAIDGFNAMLPSIEKVVEKLQDGVEWFSKLDQGTKDNIIQMAAFAAAAGPVIKIAGTFTSGIGGVVKGVGTLTTNAGKLSAFIAGKGGVVAAAKAGISSIGAFGTKALAVATGPVGVGALAVAGLGYATYKTAKYLSKDAIEGVNLFGDGVSKGTQKAVGSFMELEKEATNSLNQLNWSGQKVTTEIKDDIIGKFDEMKQQVVTKLGEQRDESKTVLEEMFQNSKTFNVSEKEEALKTLDESYQGRIDKMNQREAEIKEIMNVAAKEKRALTEEERTRIDVIRQGMRDDGIRVLTESEEEYKIIMQRMSDQGAEISALGAAEVVRNSLAQKEKTIENANVEYDERIRLAEQIRAQGGIKAEETANKIIEEAKRQRDEAVTKATEMHDSVVEKAKLQAKDHINEVDWETGEIKSKWEVMKSNVGQKAQEMFTDTKKWFSEIGSNASRKWDEIKTTASRKWSDVKEAIMSPIRSAKTWLDEKVQSFKNAFNFTWRLPRFKLPRVSVWTEKGILGIPIPKFSVQWNRQGGIFRTPTVLPTLNGYQGFAEPSTGGEAIMPLNKLPDLMAEAIEKTKEFRKQTIVVYNVMDGEIISKHVTENVDNNLNLRGQRSRLAGGLV